MEDTGKEEIIESTTLENQVKDETESKKRKDIDACNQDDNEDSQFETTKFLNWETFDQNSVEKYLKLGKP